MKERGSVKTTVDEGVGTLTFAHPKGNSLPGELLREIAREVVELGRQDAVRVLVLRSSGERTFCGGASFAELLAVDSFERGKNFFMGFAEVILALRRCPKLVIARIQGKTVGGGVGIASAADYALAHASASLKLSELELGIGPFVVGPAVERKIGRAAFQALSIDADWRDAAWAERYGLYAAVFPSHHELDRGVAAAANRLARFSPHAMAELKRVLWDGTEHWDRLLEARAEISGRLVMSDHARQAIAAFKNSR